MGDPNSISTAELTVEARYKNCSVVSLLKCAAVRLKCRRDR